MTHSPNTLEIDLSQHRDKYEEGSVALSLTKNTNFIFGKNGTGKTTITDEIGQQFSDNYSVHIFKDFDGIAVNGRLDALALGVENAAIQQQIDMIDQKINAISNETEEPQDGKKNLYTKAATAKKNLNDAVSKVTRFYTSSASQIKGITNPTIASPTYNINTFRPEIDQAVLLTDEEITAHKDTMKADKKPYIQNVKLPALDLESYLKFTNELLDTSVTPSVAIPELSDNPQKQQFAKTGMDIHEHKAGETCAFCGNSIEEKRWIALANHFNKEVKNLEVRINRGVEAIQTAIDQFDKIEHINKHDYYKKHTGQIKQLNIVVELRKTQHKTYLYSLKTALEDKRNNLFAKIDPLSPKKPESFDAVQKEYDTLVNDANEFSKDLATEQIHAKDALRYHEIQKKLDAFKYVDKMASITVLDTLNKAAQEALIQKKVELATQRQERLDLISQTKNEEKIATKINESLKSMGVTSFELKLISDDHDSQKGQYMIIGHTGKRRSVTALSKGERNIIAVLYFMFSLEQTDTTGKPKIVVLDDPMTSNDDTMQYIMIGEIQRYYQTVKSPNFFILLTHNVHFYLNVRPDERKKFKERDENGNEVERSIYDKYGHFRLMSDGKLTSILSISDGKHDFKTNYELLWKELVFLYESDEPNLMLNPCRKICETYTHFMKMDGGVFYKDNANAKKLFDVNQHAIDDLESEQNGKTRDELKKILCKLFTDNGAEKHFRSYWNGNV